LGIAEQDREKANLALTLSKEQQAEEVQMAEFAVESLRARIEELEADVEQAGISLSETTIFSPVDGVVAKKISMHSEIVPSGKPVCFVVDTNSVYVSANIVEKRLKNFRVGSKAIVTIDALPGKRFEGVVDKIGAATNAKFSLIPQSNPSGQYIKVAQRIPVRIALSGDLSELKPGMSAVVSIRNK
jgi:membrane fusion protein (multidrug efflux system)